MGLVAVARDLADLRERLGRDHGRPDLRGRARHRRATSRPRARWRWSSRTRSSRTSCRPSRASPHSSTAARSRTSRTATTRSSPTASGSSSASTSITESGFASDMGMEKFFDITCRIGGLRPSAVVLVATVRALKHHGGDLEGGAAEIEAGAANLARHIGIVNGFGLQAVVGVNKFPTDTAEELELVRRLATDAGAYAAEINTAFENGGDGATALAEAAVAAADEANSFDFAYPLDAPIEEKIRLIATRVYGADGVELLPAAKKKAADWARRRPREAPDLHGEDAPLALARSGAPERPTGFTVTVRDLRPYTGAGWIVALCGDMMTMPGLGKTPAAFAIDIDGSGETVGLF